MAVVLGTPPGGWGILLTCDEADSSLAEVDEEVDDADGPPAKAPLCLEENLLNQKNGLQILNIRTVQFDCCDHSEWRVHFVAILELYTDKR